MVLGATDRLSCIVSLSKFYSSVDPLFLGHSPSPAFSTNELFLVPTGFGAISRPIRCLQSNSNRGRERGPSGSDCICIRAVVAFWLKSLLRSQHCRMPLGCPQLQLQLHRTYSAAVLVAERPIRFLGKLLEVTAHAK